MKAYLIDAQNQTIESIDVETIADIAKMIGYDTLESEALGDADDKLFFDEECFIRGSEGRFQVDKLIPVSGKGLLIGANDADTLSDVTTDLDNFVSRTKFL